ncbi:MAG: YeeE/YedE family protein [Bacteroidales bacterium]|nr:YeeE/YedE family protein [Bacteroidales bacterium]
MTAPSVTSSATVHSRIDWSPYLVGAGIGVLSWVVFVVVAAPLGITTAVSQLSGGLAVPLVGAEAVSQNAYWARHPLRLDYGTLFLVGTFVGALASSLAARTWRLEQVPAVWAERFGPSPFKRYAVAFIGGVIAMYGARLANGCTSGNGISQSLQLAVVGWVFLAVMFATGLLTALILFRQPR